MDEEQGGPEKNVPARPRPFFVFGKGLCLIWIISTFGDTYQARPFSGFHAGEGRGREAHADEELSVSNDRPQNSFQGLPNKQGAERTDAPRHGTRG